VKKSFVIDTNVLLHNSSALEAFADNEVVIPIDVLEELDRFKTQSNDLGRNAREAIRTLDSLREKGSLARGVELDETGGTVRVVLASGIPAEAGFSENTSDNRIIKVAFDLVRDGRTAIFVSKDINARIKADALGIRVMDFEKQKVDIDTLYTGWRTITLPGPEIDRFHSTSRRAMPAGELFPNEFALLVDESNGKHSALGRYLSPQNELVPLAYDGKAVCGVRSRNLQQQIAFELLLDERVALVTLVGQAGTGKTLLALAAALQKTVSDGRYDRILVSRPIMPLGKDIGFLPGTKDEKLAEWMQPIFDNLSHIFARSGEKDGSADKRIRELMADGMLQLEALTYIRGRSIPRQYLIVDEAQNLTPHEVKTIVSRAGEDTKVVLTGDPFQIDNPYLDSNSNGLTYAAERLKGQVLVGHVFLAKSERSPLASLAAEML